MDIFNHSTVDASGGHIDFIVPMDNSRLNLSGTDTYFVLSFGQAVINMSGGTVDELFGQGKLINVRGGTIGELEANDATDFFGNFLGGCIVNVTGGTIMNKAYASNSGVLNIYGGHFQSALVARDGGTINITGRGLRATLLDAHYPNGYSLYSVSGVLRNSTVWNDQRILVRNDGVTYGHSSFTLTNVPDPKGPKDLR
jgi:hypothetical protein